ncbi:MULTISPECIES: hypothetical protein [Clostridium]|uniref:hypothetical protein n=1 Tax=Clostridium TaxID=1485 RepID=UPI001DD80142|nr:MULTISPECIES: hypothetical protein [Clostridium]MBS5308667.1 hypothetical protein [Clostridium sp.]MDB1933152.1 hypothetical protein [Clostridium tertium]MDB1938160.1 hypothetical protein [Clostridium tertium]MDB1944091.1 hypothetical protein [Clostridium tertium]MDB1950745.1 hypothetical protein [Clostridium tertium]
MKNKIIAFFISLIITIVSFLFIIYIEQKIFNPNGTEMVYVVNKDELDKNYVINEENFDDLFRSEERRSDQIVKNYVKNKEDVYDYMLTSEMYKNEILSIDRIVSVDDELNDMVEKREFSVKSSDVASVVGGILREGDKVDVIVTFKEGNNLVTERRADNLYISKVYDSSGNEINRDDKNKQALGITFTVPSSEVRELKDAFTQDSWKLVKVVDDSY